MREKNKVRKAQTAAPVATHRNDSAMLVSANNSANGEQPMIVETDFCELPDGSLVDMIEDPENPEKSLLAIWKDGQVHYQDRLECGKRILVPVPRENEIIRHVRLPRGAKSYKSVFFLVAEIMSLLLACLDLEKEYAFLLAAFVISTCFPEKLPVAPYLALFGLPESGKTTALRVLSLLCRRSLLTADITSAAFYELCKRMTPTLLIDETATAGDRRTLLHLLRSGTTQDFVAFRKKEAFKAYGAKVVTWIDLPADAALNSRCVIIPMQGAKRTTLVEPTNPKILEAADDLQQQLLQFRLDNYRSLSLPKIPGDERLHGRMRDLWRALALPLGGETDFCKYLLRCLTKQQEYHRAPLSTIQLAVLRVLYVYIHLMPMRGCYRNSELTTHVNLYLEKCGEHLYLSPKQVGEVLTSLDFTNRTRTNAGYVLWLDRKARERIHQLAREHNIGNSPAGPPLSRCELCQPSGDYPPSSSTAASTGEVKTAVSDRQREHRVHRAHRARGKRKTRKAGKSKPRVKRQR